MRLFSHFTIIVLVFLLYACSYSTDSESESLKIIYYPGTDQVKQSVQYKKGRRNGYFKEFFPDGKLKARQFFVNDTLNDTTVIYYPGGKLKTMHIYKNKLRDGKWVDYNKEGKLISELFFKEDMLDSTCRNYSYRNGRLIASIHYKKGVKHGAEEHFYLSGKLKSKQYYTNGRICRGTEEWYESGKKVNNDFKIAVTEHDAVLLENTLTYKVRLSDLGPEDEVYRVLIPGRGSDVGDIYPLTREGDTFVYRYTVSKGGFVMEEITLAVFRKTAMGNTVIKTASFNVAANNF
jgi:antitoxin component YwqK of YwqJK toxin-antitoxin module